MTGGRQPRSVRKIEDLVAEDEARVELQQPRRARRAGKASVPESVGERREISKPPRHGDGG